MNASLHRYKPIWLGALILFPLVLILEQIGFLNINPSAVLENIVIFSFWWILFAFLIYQFDRLENKLSLITRLGTLGLIFGGILLVEFNSEMTDNPLTLTLLIAFWVYLAYCLARPFFKKYQFLIIGLYLFLIIVFSYLRLCYDGYQEFRDYFVLAFLWPVPIFIGLWFYEQWKWLKSIQLEKAQAEIALLKSQINPHFFFNTLNNLYALTVNQSKEAPAVIVKLSDMMRYTIYEGKKEWVSVEEEVVYLQNYIELHEMRHHKKVTVSFQQDIQKGIQVSPLLFIVLLENAFKHGAEKLVEGAYINMSLTANSKLIHFTIENNYDVEERETSEGIGLENLRRRLELVYPGKHTLKVKDQNEYYVVSLKINCQDQSI